MTDFKPQLIDLPSRPSEVSRSACEAAEELYDMGSRGDVAGYAAVVLDHEGGLHLQHSFDSRLELVAALEALKLSVWEAG